MSVFFLRGTHLYQRFGRVVKPVELGLAAVVVVVLIMLNLALQFSAIAIT